MRLRATWWIGAVLTLGAPMPAHALLCGTFLDPMILSTTAIAFGNYDPSLPNPVMANGTLKVKCTIGADLLSNFTVALSTGSSNVFDPRQMKFGTSRLNYNIYTTGSFDTIWGDTTSGTVIQSYSSVLSFGSISFTAFGVIPAHQYVTASDSYMDGVTVTVTY